MSSAPDQHLPVLAGGSTWHFECPCGRHVVSYSREIVCPDCSRLLVIEWGEPATKGRSLVKT